MTIAVRGGSAACRVFNCSFRVLKIKESASGEGGGPGWGGGESGVARGVVPRK